MTYCFNLCEGCLSNDWLLYSKSVATQGLWIFKNVGKYVVATERIKIA